MATKAKAAKIRETTTTVVRREGGDDEIELQQQAPQQIDDDQGVHDELAGLLELGADETRWQITRISPADKAGFCTEYTGGDISLIRMQEDLGGGRYRIRGIDSRGRFIGQRTVFIADKPRSLQQPAPQTLGNDAQQAMFNMMQQQAQQQIQMLTNLVTGLIAKPAQVTPPPDPIAMIAALKDIMKPEVRDSSIETLLKGLELGKELASGGDGDGMASVIGKGIDTFGPMLEQGLRSRAAAPQPVQARVVNPVAPQIQQPQEATNVNAFELAKLLPWMQGQLRALIHQAARQRDPALYAEVFMDNLPEFITPQLLLDRFSSASALDDLASLNSGVLNHSRWFEEFRAHVLEYLTTPPEDDDGTAEANEFPLHGGGNEQRGDT